LVRSAFIGSYIGLGLFEIRSKKRSLQVKNISLERVESPSAQSATAWPETTSVSGCFPCPAPEGPAGLIEQEVQPLTPTAPASPTPTLPDARKAAVSVSGLPTPAAEIIARLQGQDVASVEAALVGVRAAYRRGDQSVIEESLIDQAAVLQALGLKCIKVAGNENALPRAQVFFNLSLRALDGARKSLGMLADMKAVPKNQTNVQVNVSGGHTNELLVGGKNV